MKMQWDKVPERLHSESLKCLFCHAMARTLRISNNNLTRSLTFCYSLMAMALTTTDDEAFEDEARLAQALTCNKDFPGTLSEEEGVFLDRHRDYFRECTTRVLEAVRACPDKPDNRR